MDDLREKLEFLMRSFESHCESMPGNPIAAFGNSIEDLAAVYFPPEHTKPNKPPEGIIPEFLHIENRIAELTKTLNVYFLNVCFWKSSTYNNIEAWLDELKVLVGRMKQLEKHTEVKYHPNP